MKLPASDVVTRGFLIGVVALTASAAERLDVKVLDRQANESTYTYTIPGYVNSTRRASANCAGAANSVNCAGQSNTSTVAAPAQVRSYELQGATLTLALPDGRLVVVNCTRKFNWGWEDFRSCRVPMVDEFQAEFKGDSAKLFWPVSVDGKKLESETYKILAVFTD